MPEERPDVIMPQEMAMELGISYMRIQKLKGQLRAEKERVRDLERQLVEAVEPKIEEAAIENDTGVGA